jgi:Tol biopolymer transport system component
MASADGQRLVVVQITYQSDCYVARIAGSDSMLQNVTQLTHDDRSDVQPAWLPGERALLFTSDRNGSMDIFQQAFTANDAEPLVTGPGDQSAPRISPDGSWLLYLEQPGAPSSASSKPSGPRGHGRICRMPLAGGPPETVCDVSPGTGFRCARAPSSRCVLATPDGARMVFATFDPLHGKGGELGRLDGDGLATWDLAPNGSTIAYVDPRDSIPQIHLWSLADRSRRGVKLDRPLQIAYLDWDAGGLGWFAVVATSEANQGLTWRIYRIAPDGKTRPILPPQLWMYGFSVSPDGQRLAFTSNTGQVSGWLLENF